MSQPSTLEATVLATVLPDISNIQERKKEATGEITVYIWLQLLNNSFPIINIHASCMNLCFEQCRLGVQKLNDVLWVICTA